MYTYQLKSPYSNTRPDVPPSLEHFTVDVFRSPHVPLEVSDYPKEFFESLVDSGLAFARISLNIGDDNPFTWYEGKECVPAFSFCFSEYGYEAIIPSSYFTENLSIKLSGTAIEVLSSELKIVLNKLDSTRFIVAEYENRETQLDSSDITDISFFLIKS